MADRIKSIIESNLEDTDRYDRILEAVKPHQGKLLGEKIAAKIAEATGERVRIRRKCGMCHLDFGGYGIQSSPDPGVSLLIAYQEKNVYIPDNIEDIEELNPSYSGAKERNEKRRQALADPERLEKIEKTIDTLNDAFNEYRRLTAYGTPFDVDKSQFNDLIEARKPT